MDHFAYRDRTLFCEAMPVPELAETYGTPLYVYHRPTIARRLESVRHAFRSHPTQICYSVKANSNLRLLKWLAEQGVGFDVVSAGEIARTAAVGVSADRVVFAGAGKTRAELEALVLTVLVEQVAELLGIDAELVDPRYRPRD